MTALKEPDWESSSMWLIQLQMQNAATDKIHELKTDVISIQAWTFALLPGDAPHLLVKDTRCKFVGQAWVVRWCNCMSVLCLLELHLWIKSPHVRCPNHRQKKKPRMAQRQLGSNPNGDWGSVPSKQIIRCLMPIFTSVLGRLMSREKNQTLSFYIHFKTTCHLR